MPNLYRRGDSPYFWCWGHYPSGERWSASTKQRSRRAAEKAAKAIERRRLSAGEPTHPAIRLDEALEVLRKHKVRKGCRPATLKILSEKRTQLLRHFGADRDVLTLTLADSEAYLDARRQAKVLRHGVERPVSDHTIAKELRVLRSALRRLKLHDLYPGEPASIWPEELHDVYQPRERWLPTAECNRLLLALPPERRRYVLLYCHTGIRYSELYQAEREGDVLVIRQTKGNARTGEETRRNIPLSEDARAVLDADPLPWPKWHRSRMVQTLKKACREAGIDHVSTNDFRRTFASWLCQAGVPELTVVRLMGHSSSRMVRRVYAQLAPETLEAAIAKLPPLAGVATT